MSNKNRNKLIKEQMKDFSRYVKRRQLEDLLKSKVEEMGQDLTLEQIENDEPRELSE